MGRGDRPDPADLLSLASRLRSALRAFGEARLAAEKYPDCSHRTWPLVCGGCGHTVLEVAVETHPQAEPGDFRGRVWGSCAKCKVRAVLTSKLRGGRARDEPLDLTLSLCPCGGRRAVLLMVERWDDGFYDEGVLGAGCVDCGVCRVVIELD